MNSILICLLNSYHVNLREDKMNIVALGVDHVAQSLGFIISLLLGAEYSQRFSLKQVKGIGWD